MISFRFSIYGVPTEVKTTVIDTESWRLMPSLTPTTKLQFSNCDWQVEQRRQPLLVNSLERPRSWVSLQNATVIIVTLLPCKKRR